MPFSFVLVRWPALRCEPIFFQHKKYKKKLRPKSLGSHCSVRPKRIGFGSGSTVRPKSFGCGTGKSIGSGYNPGPMINFYNINYNTNSNIYNTNNNIFNINNNIKLAWPKFLQFLIPLNQIYGFSLILIIFYFKFNNNNNNF